MSVCGSKITETKKNMRLLKRVYLFPIFFFVRECFNSSYLLVLSEKKNHQTS